VEAIDSLDVYAGLVPLRVAAFRCASGDDARTLLAALNRNEDGVDRVVHERTVYELDCSVGPAVSKMKDLLGLVPRRTRTWRVTMEVAPVYRSEDRYWSEMVDALQANHADPEDEDAVLRALDLAPRFQFTDELLLPVRRTPWGSPSYEFSPSPVSLDTTKDELTVQFEGLLRVVDVPRVTVHATITTSAYSTWEADYQPDLYRLTLKTDPWPRTHMEIQSRLQYIVDKDWPRRKMVDEILCWVYFNVELDPESRGVRHGTLEALRHGHGNAWDRSDVFISMCRFLNIPTRQVYGWLDGVGFHVWAQVYFADENTWVEVDPMYGLVGVGEDYVPLFWTDIGHPPFVFTKEPVVKLVSESE
jgi:transglutaminase-like putative cysteine protease